MSLITEILNSTKEVEPPISFFYWAVLATISAVVKDNIWMARGGDYYKLYPNIYVMLHADSGLKKGPPIAMARELVSKVNNTHMIVGRSSIQGILKKLGTAETRPGGKVEVKSTAFYCASELSSSLVDDKAAMDILTDLYDRHYNVSDWESLLKMEVFKLLKPTLIMLTGTNAAHNETIFGKKDIQGGFFARTFIIYENKRNTTNSLILPLTTPVNYEKHITYLKQLAALKGQFKPLHDSELKLSKVGKIYDDWYNEFMNTVDAQLVKDETGTINRFGDSVLKVAMLISLSKQPTLEIDEDSMMEAINQCEKLIGNVRQATMNVTGKSEYVIQKTLIIKELLLRENHMISQKQLLKKYYMHFNLDELCSIMQTFDSSGMILTETAGNNIIYRMPEEQVEKLKNHFKGKLKELE